MKYSITFYGSGRELRIESVSQEIWDYVQEKFNGSAKDYWNAIDNGEVPDEFVLADSVYDIGNLYEESEGYVSGGQIIIEDENGNEVFSLDGEDIKDSVVQRHRFTDHVGKCNRYVMEFMSWEEGTWLSGTFEAEGEFDPTKLNVNYTVVFYGNNTFLDGPIVNGFQYDGKEIVCDFCGSEGQGWEMQFKEIDLDNDGKDEEKKMKTTDKP